MVELTVPSENRMEKDHIYKREEYLKLTKEPRFLGYKDVVMPVEVDAWRIIEPSVYDLLTRLLLCVYKRTKALKLMALDLEMTRNGKSLHKD